MTCRRLHIIARAVKFRVPPKFKSNKDHPTMAKYVVEDTTSIALQRCPRRQAQPN